MTIGEIDEKDDFVIEWAVSHICMLSGQNSAYYDSPSFSFGDESWHLVIYPNGQYVDNSRGCIGLYLKRESAGSPIKMEYSLGVKTLCGDIEEESELTYAFKEGDQFGLSKLLSRTELIKKREEFLSSGTLTLVCKIKWPRLTLRELWSKLRSSTANCSHCKEAVYAKDLPAHEKKCMEKPIKCPECSDIIALKHWYEHECKMEKAESVCSLSTSSGMLKNKILQDFKELFLRKENCDVVFRMKDHQEIHAHKAILSVRSSVFCSTFRHDMKENKTGIVDVEDFDACIFSDFLCFLYCEDIESLSEKNVFSLFTAADKYDVSDLRGKCMEFIKANVSVDTFCDTITLAVKHNEAELISLTTDFFIKNADKIVETVQWQSFLYENPTFCNELFIKLLAYNKNLKK